MRSNLSLRRSLIGFIIVAILPLGGCEQSSAPVEKEAGSLQGNDSNVLYQKAKTILAKAENRDASANLVEAIKLLKQAAEMKHIPATVALAEIYESGHAGEGDISAAVFHYTQAAEAGNAQAQYKLGKYYMDENFFDEEQANNWLQKAVSQGHPLAEYKLATLMIEPKSKHYNPVRAIQLLTKSANENVLRSQVALGVVFAEGLAGSKRLPAESYQWLLLARKRGVPAEPAKLIDAKLLFLANEIGTAEVKRREQWVAQWQERNKDDKPELKAPDI